MAGLKKTIALVTGSTRNPRLGPCVTAYVNSIVAPLCSDPNKRNNGDLDISVEVLDVAAYGLPLFDEPGIPGHLPREDPTPHYAHAHTRAWSAAVRRYDAFVFVTPQYNWGIPAALKNALDFLFHEWTGKPAAVVSYGGHGGGKAAAHLKDVLRGLRMGVVERGVELRAKVGMAEECAKYGEIDRAIVKGWQAEGKEDQVKAMWGELMGAL